MVSRYDTQEDMDKTSMRAAGMSAASRRPEDVCCRWGTSGSDQEIKGSLEKKKAAGSLTDVSSKAPPPALHRVYRPHLHSFQLAHEHVFGIWDAANERSLAVQTAFTRKQSTPEFICNYTETLTLKPTRVQVSFHTWTPNTNPGVNETCQCEQHFLHLMDLV